MPNKVQWLVVDDSTHEDVFTLDELCETYGVEVQVVYEYVAHDILKPQDQSEAVWMFDLAQVLRMRKVLRLQHDFEMNVVSAALVIDLLDELQGLRSRVTLLEKHVLK
ncbi:MAG: hypothetical protein A3F43_00215 [Gammaproteobacteria bacterium RIFCSPHIGHO2_12_FULL_42_10]|nr:MAG: hypothetical protein A3F43_00215 [Gammaproteobacteria bacterium RIFCSPHIGHO2_12_FULL_42_10]